MNIAKFVKDITVIDPDTNAAVQITIFKHENGGMFGIDASFIESECEDGNEIISDPFNNYSTKIKTKVKLTWAE